MVFLCTADRSYGLSAARSADMTIDRLQVWLNGRTGEMPAGWLRERPDGRRNRKPFKRLNIQTAGYKAGWPHGSTTGLKAGQMHGQ